MTGWSWLKRRIRLAARVIFEDLFGEGDLEDLSLNRSHISTARASILESIQSQLDALVPALDRLEVQHRQTQRECERLEIDQKNLDRGIDQALLAGDDEHARSLATRRMELARQVDELSARCQDQARLCSDTRSMISRMRMRLNQSRQQLADLDDREQAAILLEGLLAARRELEAALSACDVPLQKGD